MCLVAYIGSELSEFALYSKLCPLSTLEWTSQLVAYDSCPYKARKAMQMLNRSFIVTQLIGAGLNLKSAMCKQGLLGGISRMYWQSCRIYRFPLNMTRNWINVCSLALEIEYISGEAPSSEATLLNK